MGDAVIWNASPAQARWHATLSDRMAHELGCTSGCGVEGQPLCAEGARLADIEQAAWKAWIVERWGDIA